MPTETLKLPDVISFVLDNADEKDVEAIVHALKSRRDILRELAAAKVTVNATVTIGDIRPQYLKGLSGVVAKVDDGRGKRSVTVTLDRRSTNTLASSSPKYRDLIGRNSYDLPGIPASCCEVTSS